MGKEIRKLSKAVYNSSLSPNKIDQLEKLNLRGEWTVNEERTRSISINNRIQNLPQRKFNFEGKQILNLPRLPYGKHSNYSESDFIQKHFIDMDSPLGDMKDLKIFNKQYQLQAKLSRKTKKTNRHSTEFTNNLKQYLIYPSFAGNLCCSKEHEIIDSYETEKNKYKTQINSHDFDEILENPNRNSMKKSKQRYHIDSVKDIEKILSACDRRSFLNQSIG